MKASELVEKLQKLIEEHGDLEVFYQEYNTLSASYDEVITDDVFEVYIENEMKFYIE